MRKYFLELFAIGLVDSEGRINTEHMTSDALMTSMKTMEELTKMKMDRLVLETTMEMILCMFESCDTEEFTEILGKLLGGKQTSKVTAHLEALEELLTEEEYSSFLAEYLGYLTVNVAEFIRSTIIENGLMLLAGSGGEEDGEEMDKTDYKITEFHNSEFGSIRMIEDGGRLLFSGMDVAFALGYAKPRNAINVHCKGALKRGVLTSGGVQPMIFIPEGDVYRLITKSRLKSAQNFEKWVFDEVLPAIRKTGGYLETDLLDRVKDNPELLLEFAERLLAENNRNRELQNRVKDMQPKADYYDHFMITGECTNIRTTAKEIEFPERKFVKLLLNRGFLYRSPSGTLLPYAVEKNNDLFIVKDYFNNGHLGSQTLVTPKGKEFLKRCVRRKSKE